MKKLIYAIVLLSVAFGQCYAVYGQEPSQIENSVNQIQQVAESTNYNNTQSRGVFAEKNHCLYYFKNIGTDRNLIQLFRYDLDRKIEVALCPDIFSKGRQIRVCNDGYIYFKAENIHESSIEKLYRVPINGGRSEVVGAHIFMLSDTWYYDAENANFHNMVTKEVIKNSMAEKMNLEYSIENISEIIERDNVIYFQAYKSENNDSLLETGIYVLPLYHQEDFYKITLEEEEYSMFDVYNNHLYYGTSRRENNVYIESLFRVYSLEDGTTKTLLSGKNINTNYFAIYNDTLYYEYANYSDESDKYKNGLYGLPLSGSESPYYVYDLTSGIFIHIFEDVVCYCGEWTILSKSGPTVLGEWVIYNYKTKENYSIKPYVYGYSYQ